MDRYLIALALIALAACSDHGDSAAPPLVGADGAQQVTPYRVEIPAGESIEVQVGGGWQVILCSDTTAGQTCGDYSADYHSEDGYLRVTALEEGPAFVVFYRGT